MLSHLLARLALARSQGRKICWSGRTLSSAAGTAGVAAHGDGLVMALDVLEELESTLELPAVDGLGGLAGVLERDTEVGAAGAGRLGGQNLGRSVTDL